MEVYNHIPCKLENEKRARGRLHVRILYICLLLHITVKDTADLCVHSHPFAFLDTEERPQTASSEVPSRAAILQP